MHRPFVRAARSIPLLHLLTGLAVALTACATPPGTRPTAPGPVAATPSGAQRMAPLPAMNRSDFNRLSVLMDLPLFWTDDRLHPGQLDPEELVILGAGQPKMAFIAPATGRFTLRIEEMLGDMVERHRREVVVAELNQARPCLVHSDFSQASPQDRAIVRQIAAAAKVIEQLYALQNGSGALAGCAPADDPASRALFYRNQGPWCYAPKTEADPFCNACPGFPGRLSGMYPAGLQSGADWCEQLAARADAQDLLAPFSVVDSRDGRLVATPYHQAYPDLVAAIARHLRTAAQAITNGEAAFKKYLLAAADAFENDDWQRADEAWAVMNATNSHWYLRIGPDEVYADPCNRKAGFHVSFGTIDSDSLYWQERMNPHQQAMEDALASLIGEAYQARPVHIHLPDFISVVLNAGDSRHPLGAVIGQSLPNWGAVAAEGRGRTVVMSNLYTDPDSEAVARAIAGALFSPETIRYYTEDKRLKLLDIVLHEATHNFGPHSDFQLSGKRPAEIFGGGLATVLEELKAQTGALYYLDFLRNKGILTDEQLRQVYLHAIQWCFGHIAQGMFTAEHRPKPYSQVAAVHIGFLSQAGAIVWQPDSRSADGQERGRFDIQFEKLPAAVEQLMQRIGRVKATGDKAAGKALADEYVTGPGTAWIHQAEIAERVLRHPKASFVYSVDY